MKTIVAGVLIAVVLVVSLVNLAIADDVSVEWDYPSPPVDLAGFKFYGTDIAGGAFKEVGKKEDPAARQATLTIPSFQYLYATAYDKTGNESEPSNTILYDKQAPPKITVFKFTVEGTLSIQPNKVTK